MHDIYYGTALPPHRKPIPLLAPGDRIGGFAPPDAVSKAIAAHLVDFFRHEIKAGRLSGRLLPLQSGVGNIANAVLAGLREGGFRSLSAFTEVIQDGMLELIGDGTIDLASATSFSLSPAGVDEFVRKQRARVVIAHCAHPDYRPMLQDYFDRACRDSYGKHTPHLLPEALSWHQRFLDTGSMQDGNGDRDGLRVSRPASPRPRPAG